MRKNEPEEFFSRVDDVSVREVEDQIDALNEEIFQVATSLTHNVVPKTYQLSDDDGQLFHERLRGRLGLKLLHILYNQRSDHKREISPLLVQVAIQIFLIDACVYEICHWDPNDIELTTSLSRIYIGMQISEHPSVYGRWRALTMDQIKPNFNKWEKEVVKNIRRLFQVACWDVSFPEHFIVFKQRLETIFKAAQKIRQTIGQHIISEDFRVHIIRSDETFDDSSMKETYREESHHRDKDKRTARLVIGTTAIGLIKVVFPPKSGRSSMECIILPKVITDKGLIATLAANARLSRPWYQDGRDR